MDVRTLHSEAMDLAEKAMIDRAQGSLDTAQKHLIQALKERRTSGASCRAERRPRTDSVGFAEERGSSCG